MFVFTAVLELPRISFSNSSFRFASWISVCSAVCEVVLWSLSTIGSAIGGEGCWGVVGEEVGFWKRGERFKRVPEAVRGGIMSAAAGAKKVGGALTRTVQVSPTLKKFLGVGECSRSESMKRIWDYIKDQKLQNPQNKREVFCDEKLKPVLGGKDKLGFLEIAKHLSEHFPKVPKVPKAPKAPQSPFDPST